MRKIKEVLRLQALGLSQRQIARSCSIGQSTVSDYLQWADAGRPAVARHRRLGRSTVAGRAGAERPGRAGGQPPASTRLRRDSCRAAATQTPDPATALGGVPNQQPEGYGYSRFCELYQRWRRKQEVVLRQEHRAGEKLFVDYAGATIAVHDPATGELRQAQYSSRCSAPATTPSPKPPGRQGWPTGSARTSAPSSSSAACRRSWSRTI